MLTKDDADNVAVLAEAFTVLRRAAHSGVLGSGFYWS